MKGKPEDLRDLRIDGRIILKWIIKKWDGSMDGISLDQNRKRWRAVANAVMNLLVSIKCREFLEELKTF
jgi:hypothetical protein